MSCPAVAWLMKKHVPARQASSMLVVLSILIRLLLSVVGVFPAGLLLVDFLLLTKWLFGYKVVAPGGLCALTPTAVWIGDPEPAEGMAWRPD